MTEIKKCECHTCTLIRAGIHPGVIGDHLHARKAGKKPSEIVREEIGGMIFEANSLENLSKSTHYANKRIDALLKYLDEQAEAK